MMMENTIATLDLDDSMMMKQDKAYTTRSTSDQKDRSAPENDSGSRDVSMAGVGDMQHINDKVSAQDSPAKASNKQKENEISNASNKWKENEISNSQVDMKEEERKQK